MLSAFQRLACLSAGCLLAAMASAAEPAPPAPQPPPPSFDQVMAAASQGSAEAQLTLGLMYEERGSHTNAVRWYRKAAEQGHLEAQYRMGAACGAGSGVAHSFLEAARWFRLAAERGYAPAQYNFGVCHEKGLGVAADQSVALEWYRKAADQGDEYAQKALGVFYEKGKSVKADAIEAVKWYTLAANRGLANGAKLRDQLAAKLTPVEKTEVIKRVAAFNAEHPQPTDTGIPAKPAQPKIKTPDFLE